MNVQLRFEGGADLVKRLAMLPEALSLKVQRDALRAAAEPMRLEAVALAPRGPVAPHLADHIIVGVPRSGLEDVVGPDEAVIAMGPEKAFFYGFFWEYGTIKLAARPFMRPAFDSKAPISLNLIGSRLWEAIRKALPSAFVTSSAATRGSRTV